MVKLVIKANAKENKAQAQQTDVLATEFGVNGLKSVGGSSRSGSVAYDSLTKIFFNAPKPVPGCSRSFRCPPVALRPESWVPATVATYQTFSWDLDNAFTAVNDLVNKFQPGMINLVEQQLVGPNGGQPLSFKNDIFGPLGDRISVISDFKKPIKEDSQRMLVAVALEDSKAFQNTLTRLFEITGAAPKKREFQGTTIYDFDVNLPNGSARQCCARSRADQRRDRQGRRSSSRPTRPCSSKYFGRATRPWPTAPLTRRSPRRFPRRSAA